MDPKDITVEINQDTNELKIISGNKTIRVEFNSAIVRLPVGLNHYESYYYGGGDADTAVCAESV